MAATINTSESVNADSPRFNLSDKVRDVSGEVAEHRAQATKNYIESNKTSLDIAVDHGSNTVIVKVISEADGKVIREIPLGKRLNLFV